MDGDDIANPERIRLQAAVLDWNPGIELVSSDFSSFVNPDVDSERSHIATYYSAVGQMGGLAHIYPNTAVIDDEASLEPIMVRWGHVYEALIVGNFVHPPTVMVRRTVFEKAGVFDETLKYNSDYDLIVRIARLGDFAIVDQPLLRYRRSSTQMSHYAGGGRIPMETVRILEKVQEEDPGFHAKRQSLFRLRVAESLIEAAESIGPADRSKALKLWLRGVRLLPIFSDTARAFARILTPRFLVVTYKGLRRVVRVRLVSQSSVTWHSQRN
jgi:hypothetical protein